MRARAREQNVLSTAYVHDITLELKLWGQRSKTHCNLKRTRCQTLVPSSASERALWRGVWLEMRLPG